MAEAPVLALPAARYSSTASTESLPMEILSAPDLRREGGADCWLATTGGWEESTQRSAAHWQQAVSGGAECPPSPCLT